MCSISHYRSWTTHGFVYMPFAFIFNDCQMSSFLAPSWNYLHHYFIFFRHSNSKMHRSGTFHRVRTCEDALYSPWNIFFHEWDNLGMNAQISCERLLKCCIRNCRFYLALREYFSLLEIATDVFVLYKKNHVNSEWNTKELFYFSLFLLPFQS